MKKAVFAIQIHVITIQAANTANWVTLFGFGHPLLQVMIIILPGIGVLISAMGIWGAAMRVINILSVV